MPRVRLWRAYAGPNARDVTRSHGGERHENLARVRPASRDEILQRVRLEVGRYSGFPAFRGRDETQPRGGVEEGRALLRHPTNPRAIEASAPAHRRDEALRDRGISSRSRS